MGTFLTILMWVILIVVSIFSVFFGLAAFAVTGGAMLYLEENGIDVNGFDVGYWTKKFIHVKTK